MKMTAMMMEMIAAMMEIKVMRMMMLSLISVCRKIKQHSRLSTSKSLIMELPRANSSILKEEMVRLYALMLIRSRWVLTTVLSSSLRLSVSRAST
jgi:hypothetical protein